ncbi:MAG: hypothetical protein ACXABY_34075 [Candidatus Thorarchaeota archaeon]
MLNLHALQQNLKQMMDPQVLQKLTELLEACSSSASGTLLERYEYFRSHSEEGGDCKYARLAKEFFEKDEARGCADAINWLYENWSQNYK